MSGPLAAIGDATADLEVRHRRVAVHHVTGARVAQCDVLRELRLNLSHGPDRPCHLHRVVDLARSEEHTSELQSHSDLVCRLLLEKKKGHINDTKTPEI